MCRCTVILAVVAVSWADTRGGWCLEHSWGEGATTELLAGWLAATQTTHRPPAPTDPPYTHFRRRKKAPIRQIRQTGPAPHPTSEPARPTHHTQPCRNLTLHRRKKAQIRPLPQLQKGHGRQAMASEGEAGEAAAASPAGASSAAAAGGLAGDAGDQQQQQPVPAAAAAAGAAVAAPPQADEVVAGLSRLSMAAEHSTVPSVIHFGRGRGRGLTGGGRGRGGQKGRGDGSTAPPPTAEGQ